ncbi:TPA: hypothetical protein ACNFOQ_000087 [Morganella morganii]
MIIKCTFEDGAVSYTQATTFSHYHNGEKFILVLDEIKHAAVKGELVQVMTDSGTVVGYLKVE